jgi:hypothetical protein
MSERYVVLTRQSPVPRMRELREPTWSATKGKRPLFYAPCRIMDIPFFI